MRPIDFVHTYLPYAKNDLGFDPGIVLTQGALESGWGEHAPGFMFFGVKDTDGVNGNEQLLSTTEVSKSNNLAPKQVGLVSIDRIEPTTINGQKYFIYHGKGYFRKYSSPKESFDDHLKFFLNNGRYQKACRFKTDPEQFFHEIAEAGYATDPGYAQSLISTYHSGIKPYLI